MWTPDWPGVVVATYGRSRNRRLSGAIADHEEERIQMERKSRASRTRRIAGIALAAGATLAALATGTAAASQAEYDQGLALGTEAYKYGLPLVTTNKTYLNQTSVNVSNGRGFGPVNRFNSVRQFSTPDDRSVVAPNFDTLYSIACLDLKKQPQVIHVPKIKHRYYVIPLLDPYTENFGNLGSVEKTKPGDYAIVGPNDATTKLPKGVKRIKSNYDRVWIIMRTYADESDSGDFNAVHKIQNQTTITPLNKFGKKGWKPPKPKNPDTTVEDPGLPTGMAYFDKLGELLKRYPPPAADAPELAKLAQIGVGPGMTPSTNAGLSADTVRGMTDAVAGGDASVVADATADYVAGFAAHNGYLTVPTGNYGTDYRLRAEVTRLGLGALPPEQAIYPLGQVDHTLAPLSGDKRYVLHIPAGQLPPVSPTKGFWSLTLYDLDGFLVPNPIDRYLINDRTDLHANSDGSVDLYVQSTQPTDPDQAQNWLPSPAGQRFRLLWRLYATLPDQVQGVLDGTPGWTPPAITPVP
jgi:hypothetical protein